MADITIDSVERVDGAILVYFSDSKVAYVGVQELYALAVDQKKFLRSQTAHRQAQEGFMRKPNPALTKRKQPQG
ncbi:hypothetical protein AciPR4_1464 [Terriglobus saanensis SP1PR4]|uniref:Uncharacterized protein n=1 Tax=Terriglobus saanensis (strain ATCC BAA-1853 / DSM 23119 / SP1PR4) TaxID=401053 RepID=E8V0Z6_TERSS|nr:hypothetical protein AciPR4_1464 [Terriglobus saanensis SP1PR4]